MVPAFYYIALIEDEDAPAIGNLIKWLDYNGYTVVPKSVKEFTDAAGNRKAKGSMDVEIAVHAMELAEHVDQIVLFSGNGNLRALVVADELRLQADVFTDLD